MDGRRFTLLQALLAVWMSLAVGAAQGQQRTLTPEQEAARTRALEDAKATGRTHLERKNYRDEGSFRSNYTTNMPTGTPSSLPSGDARYPSGTDLDPRAVLTLTQIDNCRNAVLAGTPRDAALSELCKDAIQPTGASPNTAALTAARLMDICERVVAGRLAPRTPLDTFCQPMVLTKQATQRNMAVRDGERESLPTSITVPDRARPNITTDAIRNSYSACTTESREVPGSGITEEEVCVVSRVATQNNNCTKTLSPQVTWSCPAGAVSGPTRVTAGTLLQAGRYTCEVQVPRNVYVCPTGSTGPTDRVVPPGTSPVSACTRPDGSVFAATLTIVNDIETRDATYNVTDRWSSGCNALESNTPDVDNQRRPPLGSQIYGVWAPYNNAPNTQRCRVSQSTCLDAGNGTARLISDVPVNRACWQASESFSCMTTQTTSMCDDNPRCTPIAGSEVCQQQDPYSSACFATEFRRSCVVQDPVRRDVTSCDNQTYCPDGNCWDTGYKADEDFGSVLGLFAGAQQGGRYFNANNMQIFKGSGASCNMRWGGILNCCNRPGLTNWLYKAQHIADSIKPPRFGSNDENDKPSYSKYENNFLFSGDPNGGAMLGASMRAVDSMAGSAKEVWSKLKDQDYKGVAKEIFFQAPVDFAADVGDFLADQVIQMVTLWGLIEGCSDDEMIVHEKRKKHLCVQVGSYCSEEVPLTSWCWTRSVRQCCFNSMLAKIINDEGRKQLVSKRRAGTIPGSLVESLFNPDIANEGERYGSARQLNCEGFSPDQLKEINFSLIDLRPALADMAPNVPNEEQIAQIKRRATDMYNGCGGGSNQGSCATAMSASDLPTANDAIRSGRKVVEGATRTSLAQLKLLMDEAVFWPVGSLRTGPAGMFHVEDMALMSKYRFNEAAREQPITIIVEVKSDLTRKPTETCKMLQVTMTTDPVAKTWTDTMVYDPSNKTWRLPRGNETPLSHNRNWEGKTLTKVVPHCRPN